MTIFGTDNFNRANTTAGLSSTNWTHNVADGGDMAISGSTVVAGGPGPGSFDDLYYWSATTVPANQYVTVVFATTAANGSGTGLGPTCRAAANSTNTKYRAVGNASGYQLNRVITGSFTSISSASTTVFASTDSFTLQISGSNPAIAWVLQKNGATFANATDNPGGTGLDAAGFGALGYSGADAVTAIKSFEVGDLAAGGGVSQPIMMYGDLSGIGSSGRFFKDPLQ